MEHILAAANEQAVVGCTIRNHRLAERSASKSGSLTGICLPVGWVPGDLKLVTAAGNQAAKFWDIKAGELTRICKGVSAASSWLPFPSLRKRCSAQVEETATLW